MDGKPSGSARSLHILHRLPCGTSGGVEVARDGRVLAMPAFLE